MPRPNRGMEGFVGSGCKIRKRGCSSSSSSASVPHNHRLKRAVLICKRGGTSTPAPAWKVDEDSPPSTADVSEFSQRPPSYPSSKPKQGPVSARKLANVLWELNEFPSPLVTEDLEERRCKNEAKGRRRVPRYIPSRSSPPCVPVPSHSPEMMHRSESSSRRRMSIPPLSEKSRFSEINHRDLDFLSNSILMENELRPEGLMLTPTNYVGKSKSHLKSLSNNLCTSRELLKVLEHIVGYEEHHSTSMSVVSALRIELERAHAHVDQLMENQSSELDEISYLKKLFIEEKSAWKIKEKERIRFAIRSFMEELDLEKRSRGRMKKTNDKLRKELAETRSALSKANKALEKERRSRKLIENVCDALVKEIGEDKAEVEDMKHVTVKVREELEKEREMLKLADVWREERVQMKLSEANFQLEEKNAAVDQLRNELEAFLASKRSSENMIGCMNHAEELSKSWMTDLTTNGLKGELGGEECDEDEGEIDSVESDLHSIELNMDSNCKSYKWSFSTKDVKNSTQSSPVNDDYDGTSPDCKKIFTTTIHDMSISREIEWNSCNINVQGSRFG